MNIPDLSKIDRGQQNERAISKHFPEFYEAIMNKYSDSKYDNLSFAEKMYWYFNNINEHPVCIKCGKLTHFINKTKGYHRFCSSKCAHSSKEIIDKMKATNLERYGCECSQGNKQIRQKAIQNNLKKYGVRYPAQNKEVYQKVKDTNLKRYGTTCTLLNKDIQEKTKQTFLNKYGVDHYSKSDRYKEQIKETCLNKYGIDHYSKSDEYIIKTTETYKKKYGVEWGLQNIDVREKGKRTFLDKYGVDHYSKTDEFKDKIKNSMVERYGVEHASQHPEFKEKTKQTCLDKYGVEWPCQTEQARHFTNDSKPNQEFAQLLNDNDIPFQREFAIHQNSYDFKVDDILIEIDPYATHNATWGLFNNPKSKEYHLEKSQLATISGYKCIHVWDWDDKNKVVQLLIPKERIYARRCIIKEVSKQETDKFLNTYHLQDTCKGQTVRLGLYYDDELAEIMTFGKPRYNKSYEYELLRLCSSSKYEVIGGSERLFSHFLKKTSAQSVISYCDNSKFIGEVYSKLGFVKKSTGKPTKHWYNGRLHITNNLLRQRGFDQLFKTNFGKDTSNEELMLQHKFVEIYDCGQSVYIWKGDSK